MERVNGPPGFAPVGFVVAYKMKVPLLTARVPEELLAIARVMACAGIKSEGRNVIEEMRKERMTALMSFIRTAPSLPTLIVLPIY